MDYGLWLMAYGLWLMAYGCGYELKKSKWLREISIKLALNRVVYGVVMKLKMDDGLFVF